MTEKKKVKDKLTILIDREVKEKYREYCDSRGLILGKQIEILLKRELEIIEKDKKGGGK